MPINPFDEKDEFTCPRCGSHAFGTYQESKPYKVVCIGPECTYIGVDTRSVMNRKAKLGEKERPDEPPTIRVGRWWRHRNSTMLVRVYQVKAWPSWETAEPDHQEVFFETSDGTHRQDCLIDTIFLAQYVPHSQPGNAHGQEEIKTDSRDAATIAFDEIVKICDVPTWDYPGQVIRDVRMLKDQRDQALRSLDLLVKASGITSLPVCHSCGKPATCLGTYCGAAHEFACDECCGHGCEDGFCVRLADLQQSSSGVAQPQPLSLSGLPEGQSTDAKDYVWLDETGKLVSFCPCCKKHHTDADADPAIKALGEALDLIDEAQWDGADSMDDPACPWCGERERDYPLKPGGHALDCKAALLLRKHGRKVRFVGEP